MSTFLPGKALKLDAVSYIYADNADLSELMPFYFRVSFKPADNSTGGYQYVVSYNPTGEVHRFYVRLYTDSTYKQTNLQVLLYTDTGDYVYYNTRIDQAGYNDVVGGNPHLKNAPITVELYWDGTVVTMFINGFSADVQRYSLTGNHPAGGVGILAVGTNSRALGSDNFYGYVDDIVELMRPSMEATYPCIEVTGWRTHRCVVTYTGHGHTYIDAVEPGRLYLAVGGHGRSAKCADPLGALAASLVANDAWVDPLPADRFRAMYQGEVEDWPCRALMADRPT